MSKHAFSFTNLDSEEYKGSAFDITYGTPSLHFGAGRSRKTHIPSNTTTGQNIVGVGTSVKKGDKSFHLSAARTGNSGDLFKGKPETTVAGEFRSGNFQLDASSTRAGSGYGGSSVGMKYSKANDGRNFEISARASEEANHRPNATLSGKYHSNGLKLSAQASENEGMVEFDYTKSMADHSSFQIAGSRKNAKGYHETSLSSKYRNGGLQVNAHATENERMAGFTYSKSIDDNSSFHVSGSRKKVGGEHENAFSSKYRNGGLSVEASSRGGGNLIGVGYSIPFSEDSSLNVSASRHGRSNKLFGGKPETSYQADFQNGNFKMNASLDKGAQGGSNSVGFEYSKPLDNNGFLKVSASRTGNKGSLFKGKPNVAAEFGLNFDF